MAKTKRQCPYCSSLVYLDLELGDSGATCKNCGEYLPRKKFPHVEGEFAPIDCEVENAKSLRAIACGIQSLAQFEYHNLLRLDGDAVNSIDSPQNASWVEPFE